MKIQCIHSCKCVSVWTRWILHFFLSHGIRNVYSFDTSGKNGGIKFENSLAKKWPVFTHLPRQVWINEEKNDFRCCFSNGEWWIHWRMGVDTKGIAKHVMFMFCSSKWNVRAGTVNMNKKKWTQTRKRFAYIKKCSNKCFISTRFISAL